MRDRWIRRVNRGLLLVILAGAACFRLYYIDQPFVDGASWREADDATIADNFYRGQLNIFLPEISWNGPGPNYVAYEFQLITYMAALFYHLFGQVDWVGRGIAFAFGVWGVFAFYNLVHRAFNEVQALVSCAVLAVMPGAIVVDRSFLPDPVMVSLLLTRFWMLLVYVQKGQPSYLGLAVIIGALGLLTKISGLIIGLPVAYMIFSSMPEDANIRRRYLVRLIAASILMLTPVIGYYIWALHVSHSYPPYHVGASGNWVWDEGFGSWLKSHYFLRKLLHAESQWGVPLLASALGGLLFPSARHTSRNLPWFFHWWLLAGIIFYGFGARELTDNPWNFHIIDPALAGLAGQGLLVASAALARLHVPLSGRAAVILIIVSLHSLQMRQHLRLSYTAYARQSYEMGATLAQISQPTDLVVTVSNAIGDPVAICYSHRRGWVFPPPWPGVKWWWVDPADELVSIEFFDKLRSNGARWFGIVAEQKANFRETTPRLLAHIEGTTELVNENRDWAIYRIPAPPQ